MQVSKNDKLILILILLFAAVLRLWNLSSIPYTYDEFSALFRTNFDSFADLIAYGARIDGHPVGIQVFLYYWTMLFGFSEAWIKLPFILMGIASVYLIWRIAYDYFGRDTAFFSAAALAFMQYTIMYSQIARPYGSGLFFTLLMVFFWSKFIFSPEKKYWRNFIGYIFAAALCAYNHHFSLLMAGIIGFSGLFFLKGKYLLRYLGSALLIFLLYLPHLEIFFYQLSMGGVEQWLSKPSPEFFINYLKYIFHFAWPLYLLTVLILIIAYVTAFRNRKISWKPYHTLTLIWTILPAAIAYIYSVKVAAVLQFSVLIFSFPFFLLFIFSFVNIPKKKISNILLLFFSITLILTLIFSRKHYDKFYNTAFEQSILETSEFCETHNVDSTLVIYTFREEIADYYKDKYEIDPALVFVNADSLNSIYDLNNEMQKEKYQYLLLLSRDPLLFVQANALFPAMLEYHYYDQGSFYAFSRNGKTENLYYYESVLDFSKQEYGNWIFDHEKIHLDSIKEDYYYQMDSSMEYGLSLVLPFDFILDTKADYLDASAWVYCLNDSVSADLVITIERDTTVVYFRSFPININTLPSKQWIPICGALFMPDIAENIENTIMKVFIWNKGSSMRVKNMRVGFRKGNPDIYWIVNDEIN